jgi:hypothetical protein
VKPYIVLGTYKPARGDFKAKKLGRLFCAKTLGCGLTPHDDPAHGPLENVAWRSQALHAEMRTRTFKTKQAEGWHQDGDLTPGSKMDCGIVTWATSSPTEIRFKGRIYQARPFELVLFRNTSCSHRRPPGCKRRRWLFRQRVQIPAGFFKELA